MANTNAETNSNFNSSNGQNAEVINLLKAVLTQVNVLTGNVEDLKVEVREVKSDVRELKSWANVTDNRLANMENKIVDFATQLNNLDEKVETRLYDTRPIWQTVLARLDQLEAKLEAVKGDVATIKADVAANKSDQEILKQNQENLEKEFKAFRQEVLSRLDELSDQKHYVDFLTLKSARMQLELNEIKAEVAALQQR